MKNKPTINPSVTVNIMQVYNLWRWKHISLMFLQGETLTLVISVWGTDITREMCLGSHIFQGNTYHCNTVLASKIMEVTRLRPFYHQVSTYYLTCSSRSAIFQPWLYSYGLAWVWHRFMGTACRPEECMVCRCARAVDIARCRSAESARWKHRQ